MPYARNLDARIVQLAAPTSGVIHATTLREHNICRRSVLDRVADGRMTRALDRTYYVGPAAHQPTDEMRCFAAVLHAGPGARISHGTALVRAGVWDADRHDGTIHVTSRSARRQLPDEGFRFHQVRKACSGLPALAVAGAPTLAVMHALLSAASSHTPHQLASMIDRATYRRLLAVDDLRAAVVCTPRPGVEHLREALRLVDIGSVGTRSRAEDQLLAALQRAGIAPDLVNVRGALGLPSDEPDFVWIDARLNVECDGGHHLMRRQREDDARRDAAAIRLGWQVDRYSARRVWGHVDEVVCAIAKTLATRRAWSSKSHRVTVS
ncbi:MAG: uncharacterized protein JWL76_1126 [Thermoleophilia bacterium]|nr:uncharacterized protein [Thermoleophilia bacterium]